MGVVMMESTGFPFQEYYRRLLMVAFRTGKKIGAVSAILLFVIAGCGGPFLAGTVYNCPPNYEKYVDSVRVTLRQANPPAAVAGKFALIPDKDNRTFTFKIGSSDIERSFGKAIRTKQISEATIDFEKYIDSKIITQKVDRTNRVEERLTRPERIKGITRDDLCGLCKSAADSLSTSFFKVYGKLTIPEETLVFPASNRVKNKLRLTMQYNPTTDSIDCRRVEPRRPHVPGE